MCAPLGGLQTYQSLAKWAQNLHPQRLEIRHIARDHGQAMHPRRGGDHGVFVERVGLSVHQPRPNSKYAPIHRQHLVGGSQLIKPSA